MENKAKIISLFSVIILTINLACKNNRLKNYELCELGANGKYSITLKENIVLDAVYVDNKAFTIDKIIDCSTFDYLYKFSEDSIKFNNPYYKHNPPKNYFKDKKYIYFLTCGAPNNCQLVKKCTINDYELIGGEYLRIRSEVYWSGHKIKNVDVNTFNTINVIQDKSEWELTVGFDKNSIYDGYNIMSKKRFESLYWINKDSIKSKYHY